MDITPILINSVLLSLAIAIRCVLALTCMILSACLSNFGGVLLTNPYLITVVSGRLNVAKGLNQQIKLSSLKEFQI
jgi:hypothetical protein